MLRTGTYEPANGHNGNGNGHTGNTPSTGNGHSAASNGGEAETGSAPACPKCGGPMWDNREGKKNPKAPDYKCKSTGCDGVIWPAKAQPAPSSVPF